jgi:hypothetical protein
MPPVAVDADMAEAMDKSLVLAAPAVYGVCSHIGQRRFNEDAVCVPSGAVPPSSAGLLFAGRAEWAGIAAGVWQAGSPARVCKSTTKGYRLNPVR